MNMINSATVNTKQTGFNRFLPFITTILFLAASSSQAAEPPLPFGPVADGTAACVARNGVLRLRSLHCEHVYRQGMGLPPANFEPEQF
jgi:hypothetical protein